MNIVGATSSKSRFGLVTARAGLATLATACGVLAFASPAWSDNLSIVTTGHAWSANPSVVTTVVNFADLNLNSEPGAKALHGRLRHASQRVCSGLEGRELRQVFKRRSCVDGALARAVEKIDEPMLTSYHLAWINQNENSAEVMVAKDVKGK